MTTVIEQIPPTILNGAGVVAMVLPVPSLRPYLRQAAHNGWLDNSNTLIYNFSPSTNERSRASARGITEELLYKHLPEGSAARVSNQHFLEQLTKMVASHHPEKRVLGVRVNYLVHAMVITWQNSRDETIARITLIEFA